MDKRFSKAQYDPKFMTPSSKVTKVKIDKRFSKMLKDPSFNSSSTIDRYGRAINEKSQNKELNEYYYMDGE
jgi:predicted ATPase